MSYKRIYRGKEIKIGPETELILDALKPEYADNITSQPWEFKRISSDNYQGILTSDYSANRSILLTGATLDTEIVIPFPHRLMKLSLYQLDDTTPFAASDSLLDVDLYMKESQINTLDKMRNYIFQVDDEEVSGLEITFDEGDIFGVSNRYTLGLNGDASNMIVPILIVKRLPQ